MYPYGFAQTDRIRLGYVEPDDSFHKEPDFCFIPLAQRERSSPAMNLESIQSIHIVSIGAALAAQLLACAPAVAGPAYQADALVDSIGVCAHMWIGSSPYTQNYGTVKAKMLAANIRHIRDDLAVDRPAGVTAWQDLAANGIKTGYILNQQWATVDTFKSFLINSNLLNTIDCLEGPNEFDGSRPDWVDVLKNYQIDLYTKMKADSRTAGFPVVAPSFLVAHSADRNALGDISAWADYGNCHPYPGGEMPSCSQTVNEIASCSINTGSKPVYVTEIGYHNALNTTSLHLPASELAASIYLPRVYFDAFNRGVRRTCYYQFVDHFSDGGSMTDAEACFGLLRNDLTEKPAYTALKNLSSIMKDPGSAFTPYSNFNYSLSGATVKSVLFQKRDGTFYLALWREVSVWNTSSRANITPAAANVTITLPGAMNVDVYSPTSSANIQQSWTGVSNVTLSLQGEVRILKISGTLYGNYRLCNRWTGKFMHIENLNGKVQYGAIGAGSWSSYWKLIRNSEGYYRIQSVWTGDHAHVEGQLGYLQYGVIADTMWSSQWNLVKNAEGYYTLQNRWTGKLLHTENLLGYVQCGTISGGAMSAQWSFSLTP